MTQQATSVDFACGAVDYDIWIQNNFAYFFKYCTAEDSIFYNKTFTEGAVFLASMAISVTSPEVLANETLLISYLRKINLENVTAFVNALASSSEEANLTVDQVATILRTLLTVQLQQLQSNFSSYSPQQWTVLFEVQLAILIPYFNQTTLQMLPISIPCSSFQAIVTGFSLVFTALTNETKMDIYNSFIKNYMGQQSFPTGVACDTGNQETWLALNFGKFVKEASYKDLSTFNANLTKLESNATITPINLADITITADAIQNITLNGIVITNIKQLKSLTELNEYIAQLQSYVCAQNSSPSSGTSLCANSSVLQNSTKSAIFSAVWDVLQKFWSSSIEQQWLDNFQIMANMFSLEFTEPTISQFPKNITCDTAQGIIASINSSFGLLVSNIQNAVYQYLLDYHKRSALVCDTFDDLQLFINTYFEASSALLNPEDLVSLLQNEQLLTKLNSLKPQDLVFYLQPDTNTNSTLWSIILSHYTDISKLGEVIDQLNIKTDDINLAVFETVWPIFVSNSNLLNDSDTDIWFNVRFNNSIKLITLEQLNVTGVINAKCLFYEKLVKTLSNHYGEYSDTTRQDIYNVLKEYLQIGPNPRCYTEGNNSWIVYHLEDYLSFCSADDLKSFSNETLLQQFSVDNETLALVQSLTLNEDFKAYYAQLLTTENSNFPLNMIPQNILCYAIANLNIGTITGDQATVTLNLLTSCNYGINSTVDKEALTGLLSSATKITSSLLQSLGSLAVGLSTYTIENTDSITLSDSLSTLSTINGWTVTQASAIVSKIIQTGSPITVDMFQKLGTLIIGVSSSKISSLSSENILALASNSIFSAHMEQAPVALKQKFVLMIIHASSSNIFQSVPANLASEIPASYLLSSSLNFSDISGMKWTTSQARIFFQTVLIQVTDYSKLSSNILQGFTCGAANKLNNNQFVNLIKSMNGKSVNLESSQLSCLANRLTISGATADFSSYSSDVLLYLGPYTTPSVCKNYFTSVGKANIDLLAQGSARRVSLMSSARACLNISSASVITKATLQTLGSLACDLSDNEIKNSDPYILQALKNCTSFTDSQKSAVLLTLKATYGDPSLWTVSTMGQIGSLCSAIDGTTLKLINTAVKRQFFPGFLTTMKTNSKMVFLLVISQLKVSSRIATRAAPDCEELTTDLIAKQNEYIVISYTAGQLDACLSNITLEENLEILGSLAFENNQLQVLKNKLDTIFPTTIPNGYLIQIGNIAMMYSADEISMWNITTVDTLADILEGASWQTNDSKIDALVTQYLSSSNASLDGTAITVLAPYICGLNETTIQKIPDNELKNSSQPLDTSTCTQGQKDLLYSKMKSAYSTSGNSSNAYYEMMTTVIGGSKYEDLLLFAKSNPEMDLTTFTSLNPSEVKKLSAENIKALLGNSISDIDTITNSSVLQAWVSVNTQTEINKLGLGVTGGVNETMPEDFIIISLVAPTSGASSFSFIYLLNACTLVAIFYINSLFL
ncbi:mesothelin isoform X1 [Ranitomeya variabilis]|uniref:mesothelin isoform X1 n=1 Tax=Ranitomeya variabilis TaxID=490064 RepID=UPI004057A705